MPANLLNLIYTFYSLSQASAGSEFISSRARRKRVMNQTMSDVLDPLVVHVLLLIHEFKYNNTCLPRFLERPWDYSFTLNTVTLNQWHGRIV